MAVTASRITSFAPQLLVDDLERAIAFYRDVLGFSFGPPWRRFYAVGSRDGVEVHLKCAPKTVEDRAHRRACKAKGAMILKPLAGTAWGTSDFYVADPDGYILAFGERGSSS